MSGSTPTVPHGEPNTPLGTLVALGGDRLVLGDPGADGDDLITIVIERPDIDGDEIVLRFEHAGVVVMAKASARQLAVYPEIADIYIANARQALVALATINRLRQRYADRLHDEPPVEWGTPEVAGDAAP